MVWESLKVSPSVNTVNKVKVIWATSDSFNRFIRFSKKLICQLGSTLNSIVFKNLS